MAHDMKRRSRGMTRRQFLRTGSLALVGVGAGLGTINSGVSWAAARTTRIRYWTFLDPKDKGPRSQAQTTIIQSFMAKHPDIDVVPELVPWQTIDSQLIQAVAGGQGPDVVRIYTPFLGQQMAAGTIVPLNEYLDRWTAQVRGDFVPPWATFTWDGKIMALPQDARVWLLAYRQDFLKAAGAKVPRTWDELAATAKAVQTDKVVGFLLPMSRIGWGSNVNEFMPPAIASFGGQVIDERLKAGFAGPAGVKVYRWLFDMVYVHKAMPAAAVAMDGEQMLDMIKAGRLATCVFGTHRLTAARAAQGVGDNLQVTYFPSTDPTRPGPALTMGWNLVMCKDSKNREAAWKFMEHWASEESQLTMAKVAGDLPVRKSAYSDAFFRDEKARDIVFAKDYAAKHALVTPATRLVKFNLLGELLATACQEVIANRAPIEKVLADMAARWNVEGA